MWMVNWSLRYQKRTLPSDYSVTWETKPLFVDTLVAPAKTDPTRESTQTITLAQGMENGPHTLTLVPAGKGENVPVERFRVYRPQW